MKRFHFSYNFADCTFTPPDHMIEFLTFEEAAAWAKEQFILDDRFEAYDWPISIIVTNKDQDEGVLFDFHTLKRKD